MKLICPDPRDDFTSLPAGIAPHAVAGAPFGFGLAKGIRLQSGLLPGDGVDGGEHRLHEAAGAAVFGVRKLRCRRGEGLREHPAALLRVDGPPGHYPVSGQRPVRRVVGVEDEQRLDSEVADEQLSLLVGAV